MSIVNPAAGRSYSLSQHGIRVVPTPSIHEMARDRQKALTPEQRAVQEALTPKQRAMRKAWEERGGKR
jgi:hypothetical protein